MLLSALGAALLLVVSILLRYPGDAFSRQRHLVFGLVAVLLLVTVGVCIVWVESVRRPNLHLAHNRSGAIAGLITGSLWILEISFNNFVDPRISTGSARFVVDNTTWGLVALTMLIVSFARTLKTRRIGAGICTGFWAGLISGLIACVMGLLLVTVWMPFLLRDPLNIAEYAERGAAEHASDMATYVAYDVMGGAVGHLIVLGIIMGALLGTVGGSLARLYSSITRATIS